MSFVAEATCALSVPPSVAFDRLADYGSWGAWMPPSFRPVGPGGRPLCVGDRVRVRIARFPLPTALEVTVVDPGREIAWRGGPRGIIAAVHRFLFEDDGAGGTRVRSVEVWSGPLASLARPVLQRLAEKIGGEQLAALARAVAD